MEFFEHLKTYLSEKEIGNLKQSLNEKSKTAVLLNANKMSDERFLSLYPSVIKHPVVQHAFIYDKKEYDLGKCVWHELGCFYIQEPSAMLPAYLLQAEEDDVVLDVCAAPGGKTIQTSLLMKDTGLIISNDLSRSRCSILVENLERMGIGNVAVVNNDLSLIKDKISLKFDKIILDAPCSGSGMFRKDEKMKEDWSYNKVLKFAEVQKELILIAFDLLKPGGTLCYSTCSYSKEEDEDVVSYLKDNRDTIVLDINHPLFYINKKEPVGAHILPSKFPGEGHYICLIKKPGELSKTKDKVVQSKNKYNLNFKNIYKFGDYLFGLNHEYNQKCFNVVRLGVKIGELIKEEIKYDYHYAHYLKSFEKECSLNDEQLVKYFEGLAINVKIDKGYYLLKYDNVPVDLAKSDGRIIKNRLPKAIRKKIKL